MTNRENQSKDTIFIEENKDLPLVKGDGPFLYNFGNVDLLRNLHKELIEQQLDPTIAIHYHDDGCLYYTPLDSRWKDELVAVTL